MIALVILVGCGRIGFDPSDGGGGDDSPVAVTYRGEVLADRPIGYWRLGDPTRIVDELGGPDGVLVGSCQLGELGLLAGDPDSSIKFDGTCHLDVGSGFSFVGNSPFTLEAWIFPELAGSYEHIVTREVRDDADPIHGYALLDSPTGVYVERVVASSSSETQPQPVALAQSTHIVGTYDGDFLVMYVGGRPIGSGVAAATVATAYTANLLIGVTRGPTFFYSYFRGRIDEVAIYDHALTPARIQRHHEIGSAGP